MEVDMRTMPDVPFNADLDADSVRDTTAVIMQ